MRGDVDTAVLMVGGRGMRLRPYTTVLPKPLMPIGDFPLIEVLIRQLQDVGVKRVILSVNYLSHLIRAVLDNTVFDRLELEYFYEPEPLGTCGSLSIMGELLPERFLVVNGDLLSDYPHEELLKAHRSSAAWVTIASQVRVETLGFGVLERNDAGEVTRYREKPESEYELSIGCYVLERDAVERFLTPGEAADMPLLIQSILDAGLPVAASPAACRWIDIGKPDAYVAAQTLFETLNVDGQLCAVPPG